MFPSSPHPGRHFLALLADLHNVALEKKVATDGVPSFDDIPLDLLRRIHHLCPQATSSALKSLDEAISVDALSPHNHPVLVLFVGNHLVLIPGLLFDPKRETVTFVRSSRNSNINRNYCDCQAFAYGGRKFCKHIFVAGICIALGVSPVLQVCASEIVDRINHNNQTARRPKQMEGQPAESEPKISLGIDPFADFVPFGMDF